MIQRPLAHRMLTGVNRFYVINQIKFPLQRAIEKAHRLVDISVALIKAANKLNLRFGPLQRVKALGNNTKNLIDHKERFLSYENNRGKEPLFTSAFDVCIAELEHDIYYNDRLNVEVELIVEDILLGTWKPRAEGNPSTNWKEPAPYGGEHTIISAIQRNREEIIALLGPEWQWLKGEKICQK